MSVVYAVDLVSQDANATETFLNRIFGWQPRETPRKVEAQNLILNLKQMPGCARLEHPVNTIGISHFCVQAGSGARLESSLARHAARFIGREVALGTGYLYSYAVAPFGCMIEIESKPDLPAAPPFPVAHIGFCSTNAERLVAIYQDVFGGEISGGRILGPSVTLDTLGGMRDIRVKGYWLTGLNVSLEFWEFLHPPTHQRVAQGAGISALHMRVPDLASCHARVSAQSGCTILDHTISSLAFRDPDGNTVFATQN